MWYNDKPRVLSKAKNFRSIAFRPIALGTFLTLPLLCIPVWAPQPVAQRQGTDETRGQEERTARAFYTPFSRFRGCIISIAVHPIWQACQGQACPGDLCLWAPEKLTSFDRYKQEEVGLLLLQILGMPYISLLISFFITCTSNSLYLCGSNWSLLFHLAWYKWKITIES